MRPFLKAAFSLALMAFLLSRVDASLVLDSLTGTDPGWAALAFGSAILAWGVNTWKWQQLLRLQRVYRSFRALLGLNFVGMFYSILLPGQISGEVVKGYRLARSGTGGAAAGLSIAMDRMTGLLALGAVGLAGLLTTPQVAASQAILLVIGVTLLCGAAFLAAVFLIGGRVHLQPVPAQTKEGGVSYGLRKRVAETSALVRSGIAAYGGAPGAVAAAIAQAIVFQALVTLSNYFAARSVGVDVPALALAWIVAAVSLVHLLPISLAGLGVREGAYALLLGQYGVPLPLGIALSLVVFLIIVGQALIGGLLEVFWKGPGTPEAA